MNSKKKHLLRLINCVCLFGCAQAASAHDSWLITDQNKPNKGDEVWLSFVTGEEFPLGDKATAPGRVASFVDLTSDQRTDITGYLPKDKGLSVRRKLTTGGMHIIGIALRPNLITMKPDKFEAYIREERAEAAVERFTARDDKQAEVVESYTKFGKTIISVEPSESGDKSFRKPLGHRLEIIPLTNPCDWKVGQTVKIEVLLDGYRWANVPVSLGYEGAGAHAYAVQTKTDKDGVASFPLARAGHAFLKAHVIRLLADLSKATWESYWASFTFRIQGDSRVSDELRSIRGVHGELTPGAVLGYRAGAAALAELGLDRGTEALRVVHACPPSVSLASVVDGIQAATGATLGRLNLELSPVSRAGDTRTTFVDRSSGQSLDVRFPLEVIDEIQSASEPFDVESLALRLATMPDEMLFTMRPVETSPRDPVLGALSRR